MHFPPSPPFLLMQNPDTTGDRLHQNTEPTMCKSQDLEKLDIPKCRLHLKLRKHAAKVPPVGKKPLRKRQLKRKAVRFSGTNQSNIVQRNYNDADDKRRIWYQASDYAEVDQDNLKNIHALAAVQGDLVRLDPEEYCLRGLEMKTSQHINQLRRLRSRLSIRAVLDQQRIHRTMRIVDPGSLRDISQRFTEQARIRAIELGTFDSIDCRMQG